MATFLPGVWGGSHRAPEPPPLPIPGSSIPATFHVLGVAAAHPPLRRGGRSPRAPQRRRRHRELPARPAPVPAPGAAPRSATPGVRSARRSAPNSPRCSPPGAAGAPGDPRFSPPRHTAPTCSGVPPFPAPAAPQERDGVWRRAAGTGRVPWVQWGEEQRPQHSAPTPAERQPPQKSKFPSPPMGAGGCSSPSRLCTPRWVAKKCPRAPRGSVLWSKSSSFPRSSNPKSIFGGVHLHQWHVDLSQGLMLMCWKGLAMHPRWDGDGDKAKQVPVPRCLATSPSTPHHPSTRRCSVHGLKPENLRFLGCWPQNHASSSSRSSVGVRARRHRGLGLRGTGCHQLCAGALHQMTPLRWRSGSIWGCSGSYLFENEAAEFWLLAQELLWRGLKPQRGLTPLTPAQCGCILPS